jgi:hypothetical protein
MRCAAPEEIEMRNIAIGAILIAALLAAWLTLGNRSPDPLASSAATAPASSVAVSPSDRNPPGLRDTRSGAVEATPIDFDEISPKQLNDEDRWELDLVAQTPEEAAWLERRGYPRASEWAERERIDLAELQRRSDSGDTVAMSMLADRLAAAGDMSGALRLLEKAFSQGSVFSQNIQARVLAEHIDANPHVTASGRKLPRSKATVLTAVQIAALLGDYRTSDLLMSLDLGRVAPQELSAAMSTAHAVIAQTNAARATQGLPPILPAPRPGAQASFEASLNRQPIRRWRGW